MKYSVWRLLPRMILSAALMGVSSVLQIAHLWCHRTSVRLWPATLGEL